MQMRFKALVCGLLIATACNGNGGGGGPESTPTEASPTDAGQAEGAGVIFEAGFSSPEDSLGGGRSFRDDFPDGGFVAGEYTDHETLSYTVQVEGARANQDFGGDTTNVFTDDGRELIDLTDVIVEAHGTLIERRQGGAVYGLRCRMNPESQQHYEAYLHIDPTGTQLAGINRVDGPEGQQDLARAERLPGGVEITEREWNYLQLACIDDTITLTVDEEEVVSATDDTYDSGAVGPFIATYRPNPETPRSRTTVEFDNFRIIEP